MKRIEVLILMTLVYMGGIAQTYHEIDTIPTHDYFNHLFLKINSPSGNIMVNSAEECGNIVTQLKTRQQSLTQKHDKQRDSSGNVYLTYSIEKNQHPQTFNARMAIPKALTSEEAESYLASYTGDPNIPTNLWINLGSGSSKLNLTNMTLNNLRVQSAMSNVHITYDAPNQTDMQQMEIHVASADIKLENIEFARANVMNIRNDMGDTDLYLGNGYKPSTNIHIMSGTGSCNIYIKRDQPAKIILRNGIFSHTEFKGQFQEISSDVFVNMAYKQKPDKACMIICETDLGTIRIIQTD